MTLIAKFALRLLAPSVLFYTFALVQSTAASDWSHLPPPSEDSTHAGEPHPQDITWVTKCHQQGWWTLLLIEREYVLPLLPAGFSLADNTSVLSWPPTHHPVLLETQVQSNCTESSLPFIHTSFHEFKLEIPYILRSSSGGDTRQLFMYKPLLYANTWTDVLGAATVYGLSIKYAENMPVNASSFAVEYNNGKFAISFNPLGYPWIPAEKAMDADHFDVFLDMTTLPWLCKSATKCAYNRYDWSAAMVRPVPAVVSFGAGVLPNLGGDGTVRVDAINVTAYGSVQLDATLHIASVTDCPY